MKQALEKNKLKFTKEIAVFPLLQTKPSVLEISPSQIYGVQHLFGSAPKESLSSLVNLKILFIKMLLSSLKLLDLH